MKAQTSFVDHLNKTNDTHWVYQSIATWASFSKDRSELKQLTSLGLNTFYFLKGILATDNIHAYLGCYKQGIYLHFIPSSVDQKKSFQDQKTIPNELYSCLATQDSYPDKGAIDKKEAEQRIHNWDNDKLRNEVLDAPELFQVFWMPNENFKNNTSLKVNFAINKDQPDLVLTRMDKANSYLDTCKPIPPFGIATKSSDFALLEQVKLWGI